MTAQLFYSHNEANASSKLDLDVSGVAIIIINSSCLPKKKKYAETLQTVKSLTQMSCSAQNEMPK